MKLCLDIQAAIGQQAGVGRYTRELLNALAETRGEHTLAAFYFDFKRCGFEGGHPDMVHQAVRWCPGRLVQQAWKLFQAPPFDWFSGPADVFHFPNFIRPPLRRGRSVVTIHDTAFLRYPETLERKNLRYLRRYIGQTVCKADALITVSRFTAREVEELLGVPSDRIFPVHSGLSLSVRTPGGQTLTNLRARYRLDRPFIMTAGTIEPRKNLEFLVEVFENLPYFDGNLVIAGQNGWKCEPILRRIENSPARDRIRLTGYVDDVELASFYAMADVFVLPSLYEGFGFPPLEAMSRDTPVVAAATGALPEILGDAAVLVQDFDVDVWTEKLEDVLNDTELQSQLTWKGAQQVARYTWSQTARETWNVYETVV